MSHTLTLELPDEIYEPLAEAATQLGCHASDVALRWLAKQARARGVDPLRAFIGTFQSAEPGWTDRHHELSADLAEDKMRGRQGSDGPAS